MNDRRNEKNAAIVKLVIWIVVGAILVGVLCVAIAAQGSASGGALNIGVINFFSGEVYDDPDSYSIGERQYFEKVNSLEIDWVSGSIDIAIWQGDTVKVEEIGDIDNEDDRMRSKVVDGKLIVKYAKSGLRLFKSYPEKNLKIYLPFDVAQSIDTVNIEVASADVNFSAAYGEENAISFVIKKLDVDGASGTLKADGIAVDIVNVDTASGDVELNGIFGDIKIDAASADVKVFGKVDDIEVSAASGTLDIRGELGVLELSAASGNVIVETFNSLPVRVDIEAVSGNVTLIVPDIESGFVANIDTVSGSMTSNIGVGSRLKHGNGLAKYDFETVSGDVKLTVKEMPDVK